MARIDIGVENNCNGEIGSDFSQDVMDQRGLAGADVTREKDKSRIVHEPEILLLDEPTTELDPISRNEVWDLINVISHTGSTVIIATNLLEEATYLCKRIIFLRDGKVFSQGEPNALIERIFKWRK